MGGLTTVAAMLIVGGIIIGGILLGLSPESEPAKPSREDREAHQRIMAEAQAVATAEDERLGQKAEAGSVMAEFERVASAAWRGEGE